MARKVEKVRISDHTLLTVQPDSPSMGQLRETRLTVTNQRPIDTVITLALLGPAWPWWTWRGGMLLSSNLCWKVANCQAPQFFPRPSDADLDKPASRLDADPPLRFFLWWFSLLCQCVIVLACLVQQVSTVIYGMGGT